MCYVLVYLKYVLQSSMYSINHTETTVYLGGHKQCKSHLLSCWTVVTYNITWCYIYSQDNTFNLRYAERMPCILILVYHHRVNTHIEI